MQIDTRFGTVRIVDEPTYTFGSQDNLRRYPLELCLDCSVSSVHGVELNECSVMIVGASGGGSSVYPHSAVVLDDKLYLAVGYRVACLSLDLPHRLVWSTQVDIATCFGIYWDNARRALISHGEIEIARLSLDGNVIWSAGGADIFTEGVRLLPDYIEVVDFNHTVYRVDYVTGTSNICRQGLDD